jgi:hypothetical protein
MTEVQLFGHTFDVKTTTKGNKLISLDSISKFLQITPELIQDALLDDSFRNRLDGLNKALYNPFETPISPLSDSVDFEWFSVESTGVIIAYLTESCLKDSYRKKEILNMLGLSFGSLIDNQSIASSSANTT